MCWLWCLQDDKAVREQLEKMREKNFWLVFSDPDDTQKSGARYHASLREFQEHVRASQLVSRDQAGGLRCSARYRLRHSYQPPSRACWSAGPMRSFCWMAVNSCAVQAYWAHDAPARPALVFAGALPAAHAPSPLTLHLSRAGCLQDGSAAQSDIKELGLACADAGPGLVDAFEVDFGDLLQDEAARPLLRLSKKLGSDQANGCHLDADSNAWLQAFEQVNGPEGRAGQRHGLQGTCLGPVLWKGARTCCHGALLLFWAACGQLPATVVVCLWLQHKHTLRARRELQ